MYSKYLKRFFDFLLSVLGVICLSPIFIIVIILIKIDSKGPIIFKQKRIGKDKKEFEIYKFRSMRIDAPKNAPTHTLENPNMYITKFGQFIRKTSLDELPQLINIIKGDMSIVGPRPALWNQYDLIAERDKYNANSIRPGLTGYAQVNGRDELPIEVKAKYDGEYLSKYNFLFDLKIMFLTVFKVLKRDGIKEGK
ncbi:MAG: sugar transferase [Erysipelotrichaceae bacterium]|nr:sugar transferase [Erysipelotrichaceae bacterium]